MSRRFAIPCAAVLLLTLIPVAACHADAQDAPQAGGDQDLLLAEQRQAMARLEPWIGEWEGRGWARSPEGRTEFTIHESVRPKLGGIALLIEGLGKSIDPESGEQVVSHDALAVVTWDPAADRYVFRHYTASGHAGEDELMPIEDGWRWGFTVANEGPQVRFTIELGDGTWHERGEVSTDGGERWFPTLEMTLRRTGDG